MSKKRDQGTPEEDRSASEYYRLNVKAVDDLVGANEENSPEVSEEELRKYRSPKRISLSDGAKAILIKVWFAGAVCFFFLWGLGGYLQSPVDQIALLGFALGIVTDLLTNNVLRFLAGTEGAMDRFMMLPQKRFATLPLNILYGIVLMVFVVTAYQVINMALVGLNGRGDTVPLGVEPILFGVITVMWDQLFLWMKRTIRGWIGK